MEESGEQAPVKKDQEAWAALPVRLSLGEALARIYETFPLSYPQGGKPMMVIAFATEGAQLMAS